MLLFTPRFTGCFRYSLDGLPAGTGLKIDSNSGVFSGRATEADALHFAASRSDLVTDRVSFLFLSEMGLCILRHDL